MNQRQIEAFRLVMLRGSMTAAAEEMGTSQPSVSRLIAELEAATGLALFVRHGGRIRATDAGTAFYREVDRSFVGLEKLGQAAREIRQFGSGRLRLVAAPIMALSFLPAVIEDFLAEHPRVAVSLEMRSEGTIQRWASSSSCDIGFATTPPEVVEVTSVDLYRLPGVCALPAGHVLAARERIVAADLRGERLILPSYADDTRASVDRVLRQAEALQVPAIETPYGATICALVARGLGVGGESAGDRGDEPRAHRVPAVRAGDPVSRLHRVPAMAAGKADRAGVPGDGAGAHGEDPGGDCLRLVLVDAIRRLGRPYPPEHRSFRIRKHFETCMK
ncbi:LysR substrate-binding domain-containing protein [Burkholderia gladioli]|uniref:LysR substrate-binding domain-containing protein n=1 Tax=Burkholderia gladioli TaxID=28095 RepID=UPI001FC80273|nr:LysR substrate-binding domain-containing protein [Burkholderia gladioli]